MPIFSPSMNVAYWKSFYTLAIILLTILFLYFLHVAFYHCPKSHYGYKGEGKEENQTGSPTRGFTTIQSNGSNIHGGFGKHTHKKGKVP